MKIINVDGKLQTTGSWDETRSLADAQARATVRLRTELRAMLSGNVQFHVDPNAAPAPAPAPAELWHTSNPGVIGVYIASRSHNRNACRYWDGIRWSRYWEVEDPIEFAHTLSMLPEDDRSNPRPICWLRLVSPSRPGKADTYTWHDTPPPRNGVYITTLFPHNQFGGRVLRYWDSSNHGSEWSHGWLVTYKADDIAYAVSHSAPPNHQRVINWCRFVSENVDEIQSRPLIDEVQFHE